MTKLNKYQKKRLDHIKDLFDEKLVKKAILDYYCNECKIHMYRIVRSSNSCSSTKKCSHILYFEKNKAVKCGNTAIFQDVHRQYHTLKWYGLRKTELDQFIKDNKKLDELTPKTNIKIKEDYEVRKYKGQKVKIIEKLSKKKKFKILLPNEEIKEVPYIQCHKL